MDATAIRLLPRATPVGNDNREGRRDDRAGVELAVAKRLHDLNNLVFVIAAVVDLLRGAEGAERDELLDELELAVGRACEAARRPLTTTAGRERVGLGDLLVHTRRALSADNRDRVRITVLGAEISVLGTRDRLEQAILNLVNNARDAIAGAGEITVALSLRAWAGGAVTSGDLLPAGTYAAISVRDTGDGFAPEVLEHLFQPFVTTKDPRHGTGLGLAIALEAAREAGGGVLVETGRRCGSQVTLLLPQAE